MPTAKGTAYMATLFDKAGFPIVEMHSRKSQAYRTRVAEEFRRGKDLIMMSSDVSARGMDYPDVTYVLQVWVIQECVCKQNPASARFHMWHSFFAFASRKLSKGTLCHNRIDSGLAKMASVWLSCSYLVRMTGMTWMLPNQLRPAVRLFRKLNIFWILWSRKDSFFR